MLSHYSGAANIGSCGTNCIELWLGTVGDNYWDGNCTIFEQAMAVTVYNPRQLPAPRSSGLNGMITCRFMSVVQIG
jgi:conjugal transfer mating pair stabilization protein TraN